MARDKGAGFTKIENEISQSKDLTVAEKGFYVVLKSFLNRKSKRCFPSMETICERSGVAKNTAKAYRKKLKNLGFLDWSETVGRGNSCQYYFPVETDKRVNHKPLLEDKKVSKRVNQGTAKGSNSAHKRGQKLTPNHNITRNTQPQSNDVVCGDSEKDKKQPPQEIEDYINLKVAHVKDGGSLKGTTASYRAGLLKIWRYGDLDISDLDELKEINRPEVEKDPYRAENQRREAKLDKTTDAYYLTELLFKLNVERLPEYRFPEFLHDDVRYFRDLIKEHPPAEIEKVLRYHHENNKNLAFIQDPFCFTKEYDRLAVEYRGF